MTSGGAEAVVSAERRRAPRDVTLSSIAAMWLGERWLIMTVAVAASFILVVVALVKPRTYSSTVRFMSQTSNGALSQIAGLAAELGGAGGGLEPDQSADFYGDLVHTKAFLRGLAGTEYRYSHGGHFVAGNIATIYRLDYPSAARTMEAAAALVDGMLDVRISKLTQVVTVVVTTDDSSLSVQMANRITSLIDSANTARRHGQATAERLFLEGRLAVASRDLDSAIARERIFLETNRTFQDSPRLVFENQLLQQETQLRQGLFASLSQSYEQARIDEVRNTPVIAIVEAPIAAARPNGRRLAVKCVLSILLASVIGLLVGSLKRFWRDEESAYPMDVNELRRIIALMKADAVHVSGIVAHVVRRGWGQ